MRFTYLDSCVFLLDIGKPQSSRCYYEMQGGAAGKSGYAGGDLQLSSNLHTITIRSSILH